MDITDLNKISAFCSSHTLNLNRLNIPLIAQRKPMDRTNISFQYYEVKNKHFLLFYISLVCYIYLIFKNTLSCVDYSLKLFSTNMFWHTFIHTYFLWLLKFVQGACQADWEDGNLIEIFTQLYLIQIFPLQITGMIPSDMDQRDEVGLWRIKISS